MPDTKDNTPLPGVPHEHLGSDATPVFPVPRNPFEGLQQDFKVLEFRVLRDVGEVALDVKKLADGQSAIVKDITRIHGVDGTNGRLGRVASTLRYILVVLGVVGSAAASSVGMATCAVYRAGDEAGAERVELEHLRTTVKENKVRLEALEALFRPLIPRPPAADTTSTIGGAP